MKTPTIKRPCIGCGLRPVKGHRYCRICKARLAAGLPVDLECWPTFRDCRRARCPELAREVNAPPLKVQAHRRAPRSLEHVERAVVTL